MVREMPIRRRPNMISRMNESNEQCLHVQGVGVEERDDDDGADIVGNRQGQQKHLQLGRNAFHHAEHAQGESDVGRHGNAPSVLAGAAVIEGDE